MRQPQFSNKAQQDQDPATAPVLKRPEEEADGVGPTLKPLVDGAIHGGEETKPGQMQGDEDLSPSAPEAEVEQAVRNPAGGEG